MSRPPATGHAAWLDRILVVLAGAYFVAVGVWNFGPSVYSSAEDIADGRFWLLLTSALDVDGSAPVAQLALTGAVAAFVILREGPRLWWIAALSAHVVSALFAYGVIGLAVGLGSDSAERAADDPDYGVSCVLAGSLGALFASGLAGGRRRTLGDRAALFAGALGLLGLLTVTFGWYDMEHPIAFTLGAGVIWLAHRHDARQNAQHRASPSV